MTDYYRLTFTTTDGKTKVVNVPSPDRSLTPSAVSMAANRMITANIFDLKGASLSEVKKLELVGIQSTMLVETKTA
jgi:hypothetical protein